MTEEKTVEMVLRVLKPFVRNQEKLVGAGAETRIWEDLQVNSARFIDILLAFEDELGIAIDDQMAESVVTVGDVARQIAAFAAKNPDAAAKAAAKFAEPPPT